MHAVRNLLVLCASINAIACSDAAAGAQSASATDAVSTSTQDAGQSADALTPDAAAVALAPPVLKRLLPMAGGLHLTWTNQQADCDAIVGERKSGALPYAVAFTVPDGSVDNKHDAPLTAGTPYTYRLRCKKGESYSTYSNEKSATP